MLELLDNPNVLRTWQAY